MGIITILDLTSILSIFKLSTGLSKQFYIMSSGVKNTSFLLDITI